MINLLKRLLRPYVCPMQKIVDSISDNSKILDIGCGRGVLLKELYDKNKLSSGIGTEVDAAALKEAKKILNTKQIQLVKCDQISELEQTDFDAVTVIDIMHHVKVTEQKTFFNSATEKITTGGILVYKDIAQKPLWMAFMNALHDLIFAGQIIHYVPTETILNWAKENDLELIIHQYYSKLWFMHELFVFKKN